MEREADSHNEMRGLASRIGIVLLNFLQPGLGLIRLEQYRAGFAFIGLALAAQGFLLLSAHFRFPETFGRFLVQMGIGVATIAVCYIGSMVVTWQSSKLLKPRRGLLYKWYSMVGLLTVLSAVNSPTTDLFQSRYRNFSVPAESMVPTLEVGDRFFARMSRSDPIERGDLVVMTKGNIDYVKRVAAIPGDTIGMRGGKIVLNGQVIEPSGGWTTRRIMFSEPMDVQLYQEQFPGEVEPHGIIDAGASPLDDVKTVALPPDRYFLLGDNRDNSLDSRTQREDTGLGLVTREEIVGRPLFRYWRRGLGLSNGPL